MTGGPRIGAAIVNYNCADLALDAARSVIGAAPGRAVAVIVDNASTDQSRRQFEAAAAGRWPPHQTPPRGVVYAEPAAAPVRLHVGEAQARQPGIDVIFSPINGGFAAGCNRGLAALKGGDFDLFLLLNPDALIAVGAVEAFADRLADDAIGLCGASVLAFENPHRAQALGGAQLSRLTLSGRNLGEGLLLSEAPCRDAIEAILDYPLGAAIAFRRDFLDRVGEMDERYFLYFEEADWALAGRRFFRVGWAPGAIVYHRYGAATKSVRREGAGRSRRSPLSEYHMARSRFLFALKWRPHLIPVLFGVSAAEAARRLFDGRLAEARALLRGALPGAPRGYLSR
jgi:GT2 family glycosyltransferase